MKQDLDTLIQTVTGYVREEDLTVYILALEDARRLLWECLTALEELRYGVEKAQQREPEKPNQDKENLEAQLPAVTLAFFILLKTLKLIRKRVEQKRGKSEKTNPLLVCTPDGLALAAKGESKRPGCSAAD